MKTQCKLALVVIGSALLAGWHGEAMAQTVAVATGTPGKVHLLPATMETTQLGWYDNAQKPVLTIKPGDTVVMETMMHFHDQLVPGGATLDALAKIRQDNPGRGAHTLTGPIYVEGAEPGDVLKVKINKIVPRSLWGEHELSRNCRAIPEGVSGRESPLRLSRLGQQGGRVSARCFRSAAAVSRNPRCRARRARTVQHRPAGTLRGQFGPA